MTEPLANTPEPPYYAVIFTRLASADSSGYAETAERMVASARSQPGYLGVESVADDDGVGITVSYWVDEDSIAAWRADLEHSDARDDGRARWYDAYELRVARVERAYNWRRPG